MKVLKYKNNFHIFIPTDVANKMQIEEGDEVDFFEIKKGHFIILKRKKMGEIIKKGLEIEEIPDKEEGIKEYILHNFKENERTPYNLRKILSKDQLNELNQEIAKGNIKVIKDERGNMAYQFEKEDNGEWEYIVTDAIGAEKISKEYTKKIKNGEIMGVRGFDKLYYIIKTEYYEAMSKKIQKVLLKKELKLEDISEALNEKIPACNAILQILLSNGEIIEKKKGVFTLA